MAWTTSVKRFSGKKIVSRYSDLLPSIGIAGAASILFNLRLLPLDLNGDLVKME